MNVWMKQRLTRAEMPERVKKINTKQKIIKLKNSIASIVRLNDLHICLLPLKSDSAVSFYPGFYYLQNLFYCPLNIENFWFFFLTNQSINLHFKKNLNQCFRYLNYLVEWKFVVFLLQLEKMVKNIF